VIIVRHGQSDYNAQKKIQGRSNDSVLTEKGYADAKILGETLKNYSIDAFYCSPLQRAFATAQTLGKCLINPPTIEATDKLKEIDLPLWQNLEKDQVKQQFPEEYRLWKENPEKLTMIRDGEEFYPIQSLYQQAQEFWQEVIPKHSGQTILIVGHNGINRCLIMSAVGVPLSNYHSIQQSNCCINVLNFTGGWGEIVQIESLNQTSHLGAPLPSYRNPHQGPRLLLVRHGETEWNRVGRFQGIKDIPLNDRGREQAKKAADFLKDIPLDFAVTSPLARPKETAEIILQNHSEVKLDTRDPLMEIGHGVWEGQLEAEIEKGFPGLLAQWKIAPETVQMPEGENLQQVWDRAVACWQEIVQTYAGDSTPQTGLVVAHDAINKVIVCYLLGLTPASFWNIKQGNGAVTVIDYPAGPEGKPVLQAINLTSHLGSGILDKTAAGAL